MNKTLIASGGKILPIDMHDPSLALYLPLWYPAQDISGSVSILSYDKSRTSWVVTGCTWAPQGRYFDGTDDELAFTGDCIGTGDITVMAWIYSTGAPEGNNGRIIDNLSFRLEYRSGGPRMAATSDPGTFVLGGVIDILNTWAFVAVTRPAGGNNTQLYLNAEADNPAGSSGVPAAGGGTVKIGDNIASTGCFLGYIGDVIVFSKLLTNPEIRDIMDATKWRYK